MVRGVVKMVEDSGFCDFFEEFFADKEVIKCGHVTDTISLICAGEVNFMMVPHWSEAELINCFFYCTTLMIVTDKFCIYVPCPYYGVTIMFLNNIVYYSNCFG